MLTSVPMLGAPVSVCHQLSRTSAPPARALRCAQAYASGFNGSPAQTSNRRLSRLYRAGCSSPNFIHMRIVVGAVKSLEMQYRSTSSQVMPGCGVSGVPSRTNRLVPLIIGP